MNVALVTGANRGLGFETARQLLGHGFRVLVAARREGDAVGAAAKLGQGALPVQVDLTDAASFEHVGHALAGAQLSALVNNAGASLKGFDAERAGRTLQLNTWGSLALTDHLRPYLAPDARVVMVSSAMGELRRFGVQIRERLLAPSLDRAELRALAAEFQGAIVGSSLTTEAFPRSAYGVSKGLLNGVTRVLAREWGELGPRVNSVCPGWVRTRMGGDGAPRSVEEGANGIVWAAMLPSPGPTGAFFRDGEPIAW